MGSSATRDGASASSGDNLSALERILSELPVDQLPRAYGLVFAALVKNGIVRSANNPVADLGETVAALYYGGDLASPNTKGYDALTPDQRRIQVKALRRGGKRRTRLSRIYTNDFDEIMAVVFDEDLTLREA